MAQCLSLATMTAAKEVKTPLSKMLMLWQTKEKKKEKKLELQQSSQKTLEMVEKKKKQKSSLQLKLAASQLMQAVKKTKKTSS